MKRIWAPWRMEYIHGKKERGCVFCNRVRSSRGDLVLFRGKSCLVMLNRYPYTNGHLMVVPYRHKKSPELLSDEEGGEMFALMCRSVSLLKKAYRPQGFNVGMNIGREAGAGIAEHIHLHIVPRWNGDTNFMPVLGEARSMPEHLKQSYQRLKKAWRSL